MALAVRNRANEDLVDGRQPLIFNWNFLAQPDYTDLSSELTTDTSPSDTSENPPLRTPKPTKSLLIWDDKAKRIRASLSAELYQSACNGQLKLWSLFNDIPAQPPVEVGEINFWTTTSNIFRSDLIKFCTSQKIRVITENSIPPSEVKEVSNPLLVTPHCSKSADNEELASAFSAVEKGEAATLEFCHSQKISEAAEHVPSLPEGQATSPPVANTPRLSHWADYMELARAFPTIMQTSTETLQWFRNGSSDRKRARGFKEAQIPNTGKRGRGNKTQYDIFVIAKYLLSIGYISHRSAENGLNSHLGAARKSYRERYEDLDFSTAWDI